MPNETKPAAAPETKLNGDKSAGWKRVQDDCHVHKAAAKDALKLANMTPELQSEYLRSFIGLMKPLGIGLRRDLVDLAEGVDGLMSPVEDAPASELEADGASLATNGWWVPKRRAGPPCYRKPGPRAGAETAHPWRRDRQ